MSPMEKRLLFVWLALSLISLAQWWLSAGTGAAAWSMNAVVTTGVIGMALIKARFILREFMEVRRAPALLGRLTDLWLGITAAALLGTYFAGRLLAGS